MSRTINTEPYEVQKRSYDRRGHRWRAETGYPSAFGGAWAGITHWARLREATHRAEVRNELTDLRAQANARLARNVSYECLDLAVSYHPSSAKWDAW